MRRRRFSDAVADDDPLALIPNLFDVAIVLAVAFLVAALAIAKGGPAARDSSMTSGMRDAAETLDRAESKRRSSGRGVKLGTAYRLENGEIVYVPE